MSQEEPLADEIQSCRRSPSPERSLFYENHLAVPDKRASSEPQQVNPAVHRFHGIIFAVPGDRERSRPLFFIEEALDLPP